MDEDDLVTSAAPLAPVVRLDPVEPARVYIGGLSTPKSQLTARQALQRIAKILELESWEKVPWAKLDVRTVQGIRATLSHRGFATGKLTLSILRSVFKMAYNMGHLTAEQLQRLTSFAPIRGSKLTKGRYLSDAEVTKLWAHLGKLQGARGDMVRAFFLVAFNGGLRREEIATLKLDEVSSDRATLIVQGKGRKERKQPLHPEATAAVIQWIASREKLRLRTDALFIAFPLDGRVFDRPMSVQSVSRLVISTTRAAGIEAFTTHDIRRTFATWVLPEGTAITQKLMGHANAATTLSYDRSTDEDAKAAMLRAMAGRLTLPPA